MKHRQLAPAVHTLCGATLPMILSFCDSSCRSFWKSGGASIDQSPCIHTLLHIGSCHCFSTKPGEEYNTVVLTFTSCLPHLRNFCPFSNCVNHRYPSQSQGIVMYVEWLMDTAGSHTSYSLWKSVYRFGFYIFFPENYHFECICIVSN